MRMRWTPEKVDEVREFAHLGGWALAGRIGCSYSAVRHIAAQHGIHLGLVLLSADEQIRARWAAMLPAMRAAIRSDVLRIKLDNAPDVAA